MRPPLKTTKSIILQPRDLSLLRALIAGRVATIKEAADALFEGRREAARKRVTALGAAGLISRKRASPTGAHIASITPAGIAALRPNRAKHSGKGALIHEANIMDVEAAFREAAKGMEPPCRCDFDAWPGGSPAPSFSVNGISVRPDAFMRIRKENTFEQVGESFFVEVDRSTERLETIAAKAEAYRAFCGTGGFARLSGHPPSSYRKHPFRLLLIVPTEERRNNAAERLLRCRPPILRLVWIATLEEVRRDPFGPIWVRPSDYHDAVRGTPYADSLASARGYRTSPDRQRLVADRVAKQRLFS